MIVNLWMSTLAKKYENTPKKRKKKLKKAKYQNAN